MLQNAIIVPSESTLPENLDQLLGKGRPFTADSKFNYFSKWNQICSKFQAPYFWIPILGYCKYYFYQVHETKAEKNICYYCFTGLHKSSCDFSTGRGYSTWWPQKTGNVLCFLEHTLGLSMGSHDGFFLSFSFRNSAQRVIDYFYNNWWSTWLRTGDIPGCRWLKF